MFMLMARGAWGHPETGEGGKEWATHRQTHFHHDNPPAFTMITPLPSHAFLNLFLRVDVM
jgi:hypothetical protein